MKAGKRSNGKTEIEVNLWVSDSYLTPTNRSPDHGPWDKRIDICWLVDFV